MTDPLLDELELQCELVASQLNTAAQTLAMLRRTILRANTDTAPPESNTDDGDEALPTYEDESTDPPASGEAPAIHPHRAGGRNGR